MNRNRSNYEYEGFIKNKFKKEEQQVKNCFDYEFNETYKKDLDKILEEIE